MASRRSSRGFDRPRRRQRGVTSSGRERAGHARPGAPLSPARLRRLARLELTCSGGVREAGPQREKPLPSSLHCWCSSHEPSEAPVATPSRVSGDPDDVAGDGSFHESTRTKRPRACSASSERDRGRLRFVRPRRGAETSTTGQRYERGVTLWWMALRTRPGQGLHPEAMIDSTCITRRGAADDVLKGGEQPFTSDHP